MRIGTVIKQQVLGDVSKHKRRRWVCLHPKKAALLAVNIIERAQTTKIKGNTQDSASGDLQNFGSAKLLNNLPTRHKQGEARAHVIATNKHFTCKKDVN
jgi:hypothetical protein